MDVDRPALIVFALIAVVAAGLGLPPPAAALPAVQFGLIGIARGQTMRVNIVNTLPPGADAGACGVRVIFAGEDGQPFGTRSDDETTLVPGQATWIDLPSAVVFGRDALASRARVRVTVESNPGPPNVPPNPCAGIVSTLEIFDTLTGRTSAFESNPGPPNTFGLVGLARLQALVLTAINLTQPPDPSVDVPPSPCVVGLAFLAADGQVMRGRDGQPIATRAELLPGEFLALHLPATLAFGDNAALRVPVRSLVQGNGGRTELPPNPCVGLTTTLELVDALTGRTSLILRTGVNPGPPNSGR